jgi:hypothetical protein
MKTNTIFAIIGTVVIISIIAVLIYVIKVQRDIIGSIDESNKEQVKLKDNITRVESSMLSSKEFDEKLKSLALDLDVIKQDLDKVGGKVNQIILSENITPGGTFPGQPSSGTKPIPPTEQPTSSECKNCYVDTYGYFTKIQQYKLNEPLSNNTMVPYGMVEFDATKEKPWNYEVYRRTYNSTIVIATDAAGRKRAYSKVSITPNDGTSKRYDLPETEVQYYERYPEPEFYPWNPRVMFGFDLGYSTNKEFAMVPSLQIFISSYGKTKHDSDWYIGGVGGGYDVISNNYNLVITPFSYNINTDNSIFQNINIGPSVGVDLSGNVYGLGGLRLGL